MTTMHKQKKKTVLRKIIKRIINDVLYFHLLHYGLSQRERWSGELSVEPTYCRNCLQSVRCRSRRSGHGGRSRR